MSDSEAPRAGHRRRKICAWRVSARRAWKDIEGIMAVPNTSLVSVAEVDDNHLKDLSATYPGTKVYKDWRVMLDKEAKNLDAVVIGTPDHMHAPIAMNAMQAGLQIYCEKPLTRTVYEARKLREYAEANELVTQLGNQNSQGDPNQTTVQVLRDGLLGAVTEIHCMQQKTWGSMDPLEPPSAPPPGLDWDLWLGVRPERPFVAEEFHPRMWRSRLGFGCGNLGDMGCHIFHPWYLGWISMRRRRSRVSGRRGSMTRAGQRKCGYGGRFRVRR
jgi:predicted dehydrogenase